LRARVRTGVRVLRGEGGDPRVFEAPRARGWPIWITVNVVAPAVIDDPELSVPQARRHKAAGTAVARPGTGADVAAAVLYLVSNEAEFVTGDALGVTEGWLL